MKKLPPWEQQAFEQLARPLYPEEQTWVLCNFSKREYVARTALDRANLELLARPPDLGKRPISVASSRCRRCGPRSQVLALNTQKRGEPHRGPWAGDMSQITARDHFDARKDRGGWRDVGKEIVELFEAI